MHMLEPLVVSPNNKGSGPSTSITCNQAEKRRKTKDSSEIVNTQGLLCGNLGRKKPRPDLTRTKKINYNQSPNYILDFILPLGSLR